MGIVNKFTWLSLKLIFIDLTSYLSFSRWAWFSGQFDNAGSIFSRSTTICDHGPKPNNAKKQITTSAGTASEKLHTLNLTLDGCHSGLISWSTFNAPFSMSFSLILMLIRWNRWSPFSIPERPLENKWTSWLPSRTRR